MGLEVHCDSHFLTVCQFLIVVLIVLLQVKKYAKKDGLHKKGPISRDQRKAEELKIPITFDTIVESPVEEFNEIMAKHKLTEQQVCV